MKVTQITHVNLIVDNPEKARDFYTNVLQLQELPALKFDYPAMFYQLNETQQLHLSEWPNQVPFRAHRCLEVNDFNEAFRTFKAMGVIDTKPWGKVRKLSNGNMQMFIRDPSGNLIEICHFDNQTVDPELFQDELFDENNVFVSGRNDARGLR